MAISISAKNSCSFCSNGGVMLHPQDLIGKILKRAVDQAQVKITSIKAIKGSHENYAEVRVTGVGAKKKNTITVSLEDGIEYGYGPAWKLSDINSAFRLVMHLGE